MNSSEYTPEQLLMGLQDEEAACPFEFFLNFRAVECKKKKCCKKFKRGKRCKSCPKR